MRPICTLLILLIYSCVAFTEVKGTPGISTMNQSQADSLARTQVFYHGRIVPFHTVANDVTVKLTGKRKFRDLDPVRFTASLILYPSDWNEVPIFVIKDQRLADSLNVKRGDKIPMSTLFDENGNYRLSNLYLSGNKNFDEALLDLNAKIETILLLRTNQLFQNLSESGANRVSEGKISLEIFFNRINIVGWLYIVAFCITGTGLVMIYFRKTGLLWIPYLIPFILSTALFILRWVIGGFIPLTDGEQAMIFMSVILFLLSFATSFKKPGISTAILVMGSFTSLVAKLTSTNPVITSVAPSLASPWLAFHVSVIMTAYAFLTALFPLSISLECVNKKKISSVLPWVFNINIIGVVLLGTGIILGSLWAKEAWGSYWSWDPKENWAAITFFVYLIPLLVGNRIKRNPRIYGFVLLIAFLMMVITYFGVNYFIGGLHSYA